MSRREGREHSIESVINTDGDMFIGKITRLCRSMNVLTESWARIVGHPLASRSAPLRIEGGILVVAIDSQAALHDFNFKKEAALKIIRRMVCPDVIAVRAELGRVDRSAPAPRSRRAAAKRTAAAPSDEEVERIADGIIKDRGDLPRDIAVAIARCMASSRSSSDMI